MARSAWPPLLLFTDPARTPDPVALAEQLPRGCGVVYRAFGAPDARAAGRRLAAVARRRGLILFVGADPALAAALGADGLHLPERAAGRRGDNLALRRRYRLTAAAHSLPAALRARRAGVEAVVVSPVFPSRSPSAGRPMGVLAFARLCRAAGLPVYALGGVNARTVGRLKNSGAIGLAAVEALSG
jgi:thiamine-phosphate pyrophosphorylase